jgi:phosphate transport system substrate-binding protein
VARDGLAVVVHPANPIAALTTEQVRGLFSGAIRNWRAVGGKDAKVHLVTREEGSGTRETFMHLIMHKGGSQAGVSRDAMVQQSNGAVRELVRNDPDAIGYMSLGLVGGQLKAVAIDGAKPTPEAARSGQYRLIRPFLFVTKGAPRPEAQAFIDYVLSPQGQNLLEKEGLVRAK